MAFCALHVEEGALPLLHRVQTLYPGKDQMRYGVDADRAAGHHHLGIASRDGLLAEVEELGPSFNGGPEAEVTFHEGGEGG